MLSELNEVSGTKPVGDSGDELGDGSVSDESTVEIVVVGEDSADSDFKEPRRDAEVGFEEFVAR